MRLLLVAPEHAAPVNGDGKRHIGSRQILDVHPEIRIITNMHRVTVLSGIVTAQDVYNACREARDVIHFASHSDENMVALSGDETLDAEDIAQIARLSHARLVFFNSCRSAKLAAFAVSHGVPYAIATTIDLPDRDAWKTALSFYEYCREQMVRYGDPMKVDIPAAFHSAVNGDGTYMLLVNIRHQVELSSLLVDMQHQQEEQASETMAWRTQQKRFTTLLALQAVVGWVILLFLFAIHIFGGY